MSAPLRAGGRGAQRSTRSSYHTPHERARPAEVITRGESECGRIVAEKL
jgi:hypothetical protein